MEYTYHEHHSCHRYKNFRWCTFHQAIKSAQHRASPVAAGTFHPCIKLCQYLHCEQMKLNCQWGSMPCAGKLTELSSRVWINATSVVCKKLRFALALLTKVPQNVHCSFTHPSQLSHCRTLDRTYPIDMQSGLFAAFLYVGMWFQHIEQCFRWRLRQYIISAWQKSFGRRCTSLCSNGYGQHEARIRNPYVWMKW